MLRYARADHIDAPRVLMLNGLALHVISGSSADSVDTVLDALQARCRQVGSGFAAQLAELGRAHGRELPDLPWLDPSLRQNDANSGYLACLDLGARRVAPRELVERLQVFARTGDLASVGDLRFVWVRREREHTHYVALWTEGPLRLRQAFPTQGDAPGVELPTIPRPTQAQRVLMAWQQDQAPVLTSYRATESLEAFRRRYQNQLISQGFSVRTNPPNAASQWLWIEGARGTALAIFGRDAAGRALATLCPLR